MSHGDRTKHLGSEYPAALARDGERMLLRVEREFVRLYASPDGRKHAVISRFMDGSASITLSEVQSEWSTWSDDKRHDFCDAAVWLRGQADFSDILRFLMSRASLDHLTVVPMAVAHTLPQAEAFQLLLICLGKTAIGDGINLLQAIATTRHGEAGDAIRARLSSVWAQPSLWDDARFMNRVAAEAVYCITFMLELGHPPFEFEDNVRALSAHPSEHIRTCCLQLLQSSYPWLAA